MRHARRYRRQRAALRRLNNDLVSVLGQTPASQRALQTLRDRRAALETHVGLWIQRPGVYLSTGPTR
jgi:hypothetical protein